MDNNFYKNLLDNLYDGVYFVDNNTRITYWNKSAERITGYQNSEVLGTYCQDNLLNHVDELGNNLCKSSCPLKETIADGHIREAEVFLHHKDGYRLPVLIRVTPIKDAGGKIIGAVEIFSDNSPRAELMQEIKVLEKIAFFDPLTGLGNRRYLEMHLNARFNEMYRYGWSFGIMIMDIDHFKEINDKYGHGIGDQTLKMVAKTLLNGVRSFDIVGRLGGDEFIAIIINVTEKQLYSIANKLRALVEKSNLFSDEDNIQITISIGAAIAQQDDTAETLLKEVDQLMYQSKDCGRNCISMMS